MKESLDCGSSKFGSQLSHRFLKRRFRFLNLPTSVGARPPSAARATSGLGSPGPVPPPALYLPRPPERPEISARRQRIPIPGGPETGGDRAPVSGPLQRRRPRAGSGPDALGLRGISRAEIHVRPGSFKVRNPEALMAQVRWEGPGCWRQAPGVAPERPRFPCRAPRDYRSRLLQETGG